MPKTFGKSGKEYNEESEFASYTVQKKDNNRALVLQFIRGRGDEEFAIVNLTPSNSFSFFEQNTEYQSFYKIASEDEVIALLLESKGAFAMNIVDKIYLERSINLLQVSLTIREFGVVKAFGKLTEGMKNLTGIEFNPAEIFAQTIEKITEKKVQGRGCSLL